MKNLISHSLKETNYKEIGNKYIKYIRINLFVFFHRSKIDYIKILMYQKK